MERLVVDGFGKFVGKRENQIVIKENGKELTYALAQELKQVVISGSGSISTDALALLAENCVDVIFINRRGEVSMRLSSPEMRTVQTRKEQYYAFKDWRSGHLAKNFVIGKLKNQMSSIYSWAKNRTDSDKITADMLLNKRDEIENSIERIDALKDDKIDNLRESLMGHEGMAATHYWTAFSLLIPEKFSFKERSGRDAEDGINSLLNYGYALLEGESWRMVHLAGLDPYGGYLHVDRPGKPSMVLDLMEEFRQQIVDKTVIFMVSKNMVNLKDFVIEEDRCTIDKTLKKTYISKILEKFDEYITYRNVKIKWSDLMLDQARSVAKFLRNEVNSYDPFYLRW